MLRQIEVSIGNGKTTANCFRGLVCPPYYPLYSCAPLPEEGTDYAHGTREVGANKRGSGTDAVAEAHGRNPEEFVDRVRDCGVDAMAARGARSISMP